MWLCHRFTLGFRRVEDLLAERGVTLSHEAVRLWCRKFGPGLARNLRRRQGRLGDVWHVDSVFIKIREQRCYLWRPMDQDSDVLDIPVMSRRDARAARRFLHRLLKGQGGPPWQLVTGKLGSYAAAHRELGLMAVHRTGLYANNRANVSHQHTRARERQMHQFKQAAQAKSFLAAYAAVQNAFRVARHLLKAIHYRHCREQALTTWRLATSLKEFDLGFNPLADLRPVSSLPAPEALNLDGVRPDLEALALLAQLKRLSSRHNGIADLWPLAALTGLTVAGPNDRNAPTAGIGRAGGESQR